MKHLIWIILLSGCSPKDIAIADEVIEGEVQIIERAINEEFALPSRPSVTLKKQKGPLAH